MKNVLSYCLFDIKPEIAKLFGDKDYYISRLRENLLAARALFPEWEIIVYSDKIFDLRKDLNVKIITRGYPASACEGMMWRWLPLFDTDVKYVASRDADALMTPAERFAIEEFIQLKGFVHNFCDNLQHNISMMGGLSCVDAEIFRKKSPYKTYESFISSFNLKVVGSDQSLIKERIFNLLEDGSVEHSRVGRLGHVSAKTKFFDRINYSLDAKIGISPNLIKEADSLAKHAGTILYERERAKEFYDKHYFLKKERVVFSSDINTTFDFFIPITALFWKSLDIFPFIYLIGSKNEWVTRRKCLIDFLDRYQIEYTNIDLVPECNSYSIAQIIRLYAFCDIPNQAYITSDADMFPLAKRNFWLRSGDILKTWSFKGNPEYFMCYVSAPSYIWKNLIGNTSGLDSRTELIAQLKRGPGLTKNIPWNYDQILLTSRINEYKGTREEDRRIPGEGYFPDGRLDRGKWQFNHKNTYKDAHVLRPGWTSENWSKLLEVISCYVPQFVDSIIKYKEAYCKEVTCN